MTVTLLLGLIGLQIVEIGVAIWALIHHRRPHNPHGPVK
jgi:hypothetical protein